MSKFFCMLGVGASLICVLSVVYLNGKINTNQENIQQNTDAVVSNAGNIAVIEEKRNNMKKTTSDIVYRNTSASNHDFNVLETKVETLMKEYMERKGICVVSGEKRVVTINGEDVCSWVDVYYSEDHFDDTAKASPMFNSFANLDYNSVFMDGLEYTYVKTRIDNGDNIWHSHLYRNGEKYISVYY